MSKRKLQNKNGRPPSPIMQKRSYQIAVKFNPPEYYNLKSKARSAGCNMSEMIRQSLEKVVVRERLNSTHLTQIRQLTAMGNNLNQIAKVANSGKFFAIGHSCKETLRLIQKLIKSISDDR